MAVMTSCDSSSTAPPPNKEDRPDSGSVDVGPLYDAVVNFQLKYIRSLQLESGALPDNSNPTSKITPYFAHSAILALVLYPSEVNDAVIRKYIEWYISKLNGKKNPVTGKSEIEGSIYDYFGTAETTKGTYDSVDSYSATFLNVLMEYAKVSDDNMDWLKRYSDEFNLVADAMIAVTDTEYNTMPGVYTKDNDDYLSVAHMGYDVKYLMDNCEVNQGLKAAVWLKEHGILTSSHDFAYILEKNTAGIEKNLWKGDYYKMHSDGATLNWNKFYADATSQLFPGIFEVIEPDSDRARKLYSKFNTHYSEWQSGVNYDTYPWTMICRAAAQINDADRVNEYVQHIYSLNVNDQQKSYWYSAEAGNLVIAIHRISNPKVSPYSKE